MSFLLFINWWNEQEWIGQVFWTLAVISTLLLIIRLALSLFGEDEVDARQEKRRIDARALLVFLTFFSWTVLIGFALDTPPFRGLIYGFFFGLVIALFARFISFLFIPSVVARSGLLDAEKIRSSTGQVLKSIPPHRNGFGKVHINIHNLPYSIDAVTAGQELTAGMPVRIVEVLDDQVVLVEPIEGPQPRRPENMTSGDRSSEPFTPDQAAQ